MFLKTYNTEFEKIIITFTGQNGKLLEIEDKVNLTLLINKIFIATIFHGTRSKKIC